MLDIIKLVISIGLCEFAGFIGSLSTRSSVNSWYRILNKPIFSPPNWLFAPVWLVLYLLMGISAFYIWKKGLSNRDVSYALLIFIVQLALNIFWPIVFFGSMSITGGLILIVILWLFILLTIISFSRVSPISAYLLIPYILWVTYASILNFSIWKLN